MNTRVLEKGAKEQLSQNFNQKSFDCQCTNPDCNITLSSPILEAKRQVLRGMWGRPVFINSGFRCQKHNEFVGGAKNSQHMRGTASDLRPEHPEDLDDFEVMCKRVFPFTIRYETFVHCDVRGLEMP